MRAATLRDIAMERLWTPWRRAFIESGATDECFLCTAPTAHDDPARLILVRAERAYALLNRYPYNSGHLMIAPYAHTGDLGALDSAIAEDMMRLTQHCVRVLQQAYQPQGFNIGMNIGTSAGAGVPDHLHMHVVPRWTGDTSYMTVLAGTKVLPETIDQTYARLAPRFQT